MTAMYGKVHNCSRGCCYVPKGSVKRVEEEQWRKDYEDEVESELAEMDC